MRFLTSSFTAHSENYSKWSTKFFRCYFLAVSKPGRRWRSPREGSRNFSGCIHRAPQSLGCSCTDDRCPFSTSRISRRTDSSLKYCQTKAKQLFTQALSNFTSPETRTVLPDAENSTIVSSFVWTKHRNVTEGRTDGRNRCGYYSGLHCEQQHATATINLYVRVPSTRCLRCVFPGYYFAFLMTFTLYSVSQKTSPTFLAVTLESIVGFS